MQFIDWIIQELNDISDFFYKIYLEVLSWVYPFWLVADFFYQLSKLFNWLAWDFYDFGIWVNDVAAKIGKILSWETIEQYITDWLRWLPSPLNWFVNLWSEVWDEIRDWWSGTEYTVQGWIDVARQYLQNQLDSLTSWVTSLQASWDDFKGRIPSLDAIISWFPNWWGATLANIITWGALTATQIDSFIDSKIKEWLPFIASLQALWKDIELFFTDPLQWLYDRMDEWFERFW